MEMTRESDSTFSDQETSNSTTGFGGGEEGVSEKVTSIVPVSPVQKPDSFQLMQSVLADQEARRKQSAKKAEDRKMKLESEKREEARIRKEIREGTGPSEKKLDEWRTEIGHEAEEKLLEYFMKIPVVTVVDWENHEKEVQMPGKVYVARVNAMQDWSGKGDFALSWGKEWILVDLTISNDSRVLAEKFEKERNGGPRVLKISRTTLNNAALGGEYYQDKVVSALREMVVAYKEDRLHKPQNRL